MDDENDVKVLSISEVQNEPKVVLNYIGRKGVLGSLVSSF
jgi:hypothetical protein